MQSVPVVYSLCKSLNKIHIHRKRAVKFPVGNFTALSEIGRYSCYLTYHNSVKYMSLYILSMTSVTGKLSELSLY